MDSDNKEVPNTFQASTFRNKFGKNLVPNKNFGYSTIKKKAFSDYSLSKGLNDMPTQLYMEEHNKNIQKEEDFNLLNLSKAEYCQLNMRTNPDSRSKSKSSKNWARLRNVFNACIKFKIFDVQVISYDEINNEISNFIGRSSPLAKENEKTTFNKTNGFNHAMEEIEFFDSISRGTSSDILKIQKIIESSPDLFLYDIPNESSLINRKNIKGIRPLFWASIHGNIKVVEILSLYKVNYLLTSEIEKGEQETALEGSTRWNYLQVVQFLLSKFNWPLQIIEQSISKCSNNEILENLMKYKENKGN